MPFLVIMCELFNGILRPHDQMPVVWEYTMYYITPFTYWIGGILSTTLSGQPVVCSEADLNYFNAPPGQTCAQYAGEWIQGTTGYLANGSATGSCGYCQYEFGDEVSYSLLRKLSYNVSLKCLLPYSRLTCIVVSGWIKS